MREIKDEVQHWRVLASTTGYVNGVPGYVKQRLAVVPLQWQERLLLPVQERGSERRLLFGLVQWPEQGRLRRLGQRLARCEGRALVRVPEQHREQALVRFDKRRPEQGRDIRLKQGLLRLQLRVLLQRRQRPPEQGLFRGKAFPLPPRGRNEREEGMRE